MKKAQIAIEFILLTAMALFILLVILSVVNELASRKIDEKTYFELDDLGKSLQTELIVASEVEDGYERRLNIPETINGRNFNITNGNISKNVGYLSIDFEGLEIYYPIPVLNDTLKKGINTIRKENNALLLK